MEPLLDTEAMMKSAQDRELPGQKEVLDSYGDLSNVRESAASFSGLVSAENALWALIMKCHEFLNFVAVETEPKDGSMDLILDTARDQFSTMLFTDPDPVERDTNARELAREILVNFYGSPGFSVEVDDAVNDHATEIALSFKLGQKVMSEYRSAPPDRSATKRAEMLQIVWNQVCRIDTCSMKYISPLEIKSRYGMLSDDARLDAWEYLQGMYEHAMVFYMLDNMSSVLSDILIDIFASPDHEGGEDTNATIREKVMRRVSQAAEKHPELGIELAEMMTTGVMSWNFLLSMVPVCGPTIMSILRINESYNLSAYIPVVPKPEAEPEPEIVASGGGGGGGGCGGGGDESGE